jgi:hypothetical protein
MLINKQEAKIRFLKHLSERGYLCLYAIKLDPKFGFGKLSAEGLIKVNLFDDAFYAKITPKGLEYLKLNT